MTLNKARILSSENNSSMTNNQHQTTNVNIKFPDIKKAQTRDIQLTEPAGYMVDIDQQQSSSRTGINGKRKTIVRGKHTTTKPTPDTRNRTNGKPR